MNFESLVTSTIITVMAGAAIYTVEPAVTAATYRLLVINQLTDQAHTDAARAFCQQLDNQAEGCVSPPVGYLDTEKKKAALEEAAMLGQPLPLPLPEPRS